MKKISRLVSPLLLSTMLMAGCALTGRSVQQITAAEPPAWSGEPSGSKIEGPVGEGFYGFSKVAPDAVAADNQAMEMLSLVLDRFWNRAVVYLTQKTGAYGLFRTFEGAPCRISFANGNQQVVVRWNNLEGSEYRSLAFLSKDDIKHQLGSCRECMAHPLCKMMSANLDVILNDFTAWSEVGWTSDDKVYDWLNRGAGPFIDGPAGRGFYGVGFLEEPGDLAMSTLDLQYRAAVSLRSELLHFIKQATGYDLKMENSSESIIPPCITAMQRLQGEVIEMSRLDDGRPQAALAFLPAARVRSAVKDCNGCNELNICRSLYDQFDQIFLKTTKARNSGK